MKQINPHDINIIKSIPPVLAKTDRCAIDTEWFRMDKEKMHRPTGKFACCTFCFNGTDVYVVTDPKELKHAFKNIDASVFVFHNAKFDVFHLRRLIELPKRKRLWDTQLLEQIMYAGYYNNFSLADLARRRLGIYMEKETRNEFANADEMTEEMLEYSCIDTLATYQVYQSQRAEIDENDLHVWTDIDLGALWTVLAMSGMMLDQEAWSALCDKNEVIVKELKDKYSLINLNSPAQVLRELHHLGYTKLKKTGEDYLKPFQGECEFIQDVLEFRGRSKRSSTYGKNWLEMCEKDGRIYSDFHINGAGTGRFSSSNPNVENIPVRDTKEYRDCFIAEDENVLIDADWSAQEPRIAAYLSGDEKLIDIFKRKKDVYIEAAKLMFDWDLTKKDPRRSERMKPTVLGASYGLTEYGMEQKYGVPKDEGALLLDKFFETFTGMREWKKKQQKSKGYVQTIYGRKFWLNPYMEGHSDNNALNSPVQGSAADALKIAAYRFLNEWGWSDRNSVLVNLMHDELLIEVPMKLKDLAIQMLKKVMIEVAEEMHDGIPSEIEIGHASSWASAHQ